MFILLFISGEFQCSKRFSSYKSLRQFVRRNGYKCWLVKDELSNDYVVNIGGSLVLLSASVEKVQELQKSISDFHSILKNKKS